MKFCTNCGAQLQDEVAFCTNCGAQQVAAQQPVVEAQPVVETQPVVEAQPVYQQPVYQAPAQPVYQAPVAPASVPGKGLGIAGMILGIISLVFVCVFYICIPCSIIGLILGCVGNSKAKAVGMKNGMATAGVACSSIALGITLVILLLAVVGCSTAMGSRNFYY